MRITTLSVWNFFFAIESRSKPISFLPDFISHGWLLFQILMSLLQVFMHSFPFLHFIILLTRHLSSTSPFFSHVTFPPLRHSCKNFHPFHLLHKKLIFTPNLETNLDQNRFNLIFQILNLCIEFRSKSLRPDLSSPESVNSIDSPLSR